MHVSSVTWTILLASGIFQGLSAEPLLQATCECNKAEFVQYFVPTSALQSPNSWNIYGQSYATATSDCTSDGGVLASASGDTTLCLQEYLNYLFQYYSVLGSQRIWLQDDDCDAYPTIYSTCSTLQKCWDKKENGQHYTCNAFQQWIPSSQKKTANVRFLCQRTVQGYIPTTPQVANANPPNPTLFPTTEVTYTCKVGSKRSGSLPFTSQCSGWKSWTVPTQTCDIINCSAIAAPSDGTVTFTDGFKFQSIASFSCSAGYTLVGSSNVSCDANQKWSGDQPKCRPVDCHEPPTLPLANPTNYTTTTFKSTANYTCFTGYDGGAGPLQASCQATGRWYTGAVECKVKDCGPPHPYTNSKLNVPATTFQSVATYSCDVGFELHPSGGPQFLSSECLASGQWQPVNVTCKQIICRPLLPKAESYISYTNGTAYLAVAKFECPPKYFIPGDGVLQCQINGKWNGSEPDCRELTNCLPVKAPANGQMMNLHGVGTQINSILGFSCDDGYKLKGDNFSLCLSTGDWTAKTTPLCQGIVCPSIPQPNNGQVIFSNGLKLDSAATFSCYNGYVLTGPAKLTCTEQRTWSGNIPTCPPVDCGPPPPLLTAKPQSDTDTTYPSTVVYSCKDGYEPTLTMKASTCMANGEWDLKGISCQVFHCPRVPVLSNGYIAWSNGTTYNAVTNFSCLPDFEISSGAGISRCQLHKTWSDARGECIAKPVSGKSSLGPGSEAAIVLGSVLFIVTALIVAVIVMYLVKRGDGTTQPTAPPEE